MVNRIGHGDETVDSEALDRRLKSLSNFQAMLLLHALRFPSVLRVVYSTCSVYERENELVIHDVLQSTSSKFRLVHVLPQFPGRGKSSTLLHANSCVRMSSETSLTIGFFIACLERVDDVPDHLPSSADVDAQKVEGATISESTTGKMQAETDAVSEGRKSRKHKKSKKEKTARLELSEPDATMVKEGLSSELDGLPQKSQSDTLSFISDHTTDTMETETVGKIRKSHKHKRSKGEKSAKIARLEHSEINSTAGLERLDRDQNSLDLLSTSSVIQTEQDTATDGRKSHKHKKSKEAKSSSIVKQCEVDTTAGLESRDSIQTSLGLLSNSNLMQTEEIIAAETKKSHKHKKSKKEKAETDVLMAKERLDSKFDGQPHHCLSENSELTLNVMQAGYVGASRKLHRHKKSKKEKHAKFMGPEHSMTDSTMNVD